MKLFPRFFFLITILFFLFIANIHAALPGTPEWSSGFDGQRALRYVHILASDSLAGRYSGFAGWDKVEEYISKHFKKCRLTPPFGKDQYLHKFTYAAGEYRAPCSLIFKYPGGYADTARMWQDFNVFKYSGYGRVKGRLVWVGYGVSAPQKGWDDYAEVDVTGAVVLAMRGTPELPNVRWGVEGLNGFKSSSALAKGAAGYLCFDVDPPKWATIGSDFFKAELPAAWISLTKADSLLQSTGKTKEQWKEDIKKRLKPISQALDIEAELQVGGEYFPQRPVSNIAGLLEGSDKILKREVIVIGAHADHHGIDAAGNIYPGADDNASGTAAMMELAEVFSKMKPRPKRSILFIGFAAEEEGLEGSAEFAKKLPLIGYDVAAMLNMDMVGQGSGEIGITGIGQTPLLGEAMFADWPDSALAKLEFWNLWPGSDHWSFAEEGIPAYVVGARGEHPNYHTPNDTAGNIKPEVLKAAGDMMFHCALALANWREPIKPLVGKGNFLARANPGVIITAIQVNQLNNKKNIDRCIQTTTNFVKDVEYPQMLQICRLSPTEGYTQGWLVDQVTYFQGLEVIRETSKIKNIPFLSDSCLKDFKGEPFKGVSAAIPFNKSLADTLVLMMLARNGVGFIMYDFLDENPVIRDLNSWKEIAPDCRRAGIRPFIALCEYSEPYTLLSLSEMAKSYNGQILFKFSFSQNVDMTDYPQLFDAGCFVITDDTSVVNHFANTKYFSQLGIESDPTLIDALGLTGMDNWTIRALLFDNLQSTLQRWWADSSYRAAAKPTD